MQYDRNEFQERRRPPRQRSFWVSGSGYYVLVVAISAGCFFLFWGILSDSGVETPWITAGIAASIVLAGGVVVREILVRRSRRTNFIHDRRGSDARSDLRTRGKLTIERNAALLAAIKQKSNAAKILNNVSAGHREVFELSSEYLSLIERELQTVNPGSPRLTALLKGRSKAAAYHRFHMLRWAEIEATQLTLEARASDDPENAFEAAEKALAVVDRAMVPYPSEQPLVESHQLLTELVASIKVAAYVDEAEAAARRGNVDEARASYREALFYLGRDNIHTPEREAAAVRIRAEIEKLDSGRDPQF